MNELQKTEFEILKHTIRICDELNLTYYLVCGSALGAVKYQGFIPWDDDMDIGLPRKDYEIFCQKAQQMLPDHLFLQNWKTDKRFPAIFSKIRDSRTTYIEKSVAHLPIHHGVYIDVFPIDGYPADPRKQEHLERVKKYYTLLTRGCFDLERSRKEKLFAFAEKLLGLHKHPAWYSRPFERMIAAYPTDGADIWCNHGNWQGNLEYAPSWHYGEGQWATFEGLQVRIPQNYDEYLTQKYGNWRDDLPLDKQQGHHYYMICDCNRPYTHYVEMLHSGKQYARQSASDHR